MDLAIESDTYSPNIDSIGNYVDKIPPSSFFKNGVRCPCGSRKDKCYDNASSFSTHIKTKAHQKWISELNCNKANFFLENISLKETISNQRLIISKLERDLQNRTLTIDYLTQQLHIKKKCETVENLLEFD
jgi:hypothetical protein